jgi:hypothetical protein
MDRQTTLRTLLETTEGNSTLQHYSESYFARGANNVILTYLEQHFINDAVVIGNKTYPFPSNNIFQAISRIVERNVLWKYTLVASADNILEEAAVRHVQIQYASATSSARMPSVFAAFAIVTDSNQIVQMMFFSSLRGTDPSRALIRQNRMSSFYSEWQKFDNEHQARCQRIEYLQSENPRSIECQNELSQLYKHTIYSRDMLFCAESELFFPPELHAINEPIYGSTYQVLILFIEAIRKGDENFIITKEFYGNCLTIKMELDRKWRRIVDASLVRAGKQLGYLSWGSCLLECKRDLSSLSLLKCNEKETDHMSDGYCAYLLECKWDSDGCYACLLQCKWNNNVIFSVWKDRWIVQLGISMGRWSIFAGI